LEKTMRRWIAVIACLVAAKAQAGAVEDLFRQWIDSARAKGKTILAAPLGGLTREITQPVIAPRDDGLALGEGQVAVFVAPGCRSCGATLERLRQRGWSVEVLDLGRSLTAREAFQATGAAGVPTVLMGRHMMGGYSDRMFDKLLKLDIQQKTDAQRGTGA
jgi:glutaredoxin